MTVVSIVRHERREPVGCVASDLVAARDDARRPKRGPACSSASPSDPECTTHATPPAAQVGVGDRADPRRRAARDGDPHAVRPDERDVRGGAQARRARRVPLAPASPSSGPRPGTTSRRAPRLRSPRPRRRRSHRSHRQRAHVRRERQVAELAPRRALPRPPDRERWTATVSATRLRFDQRCRPARRSVAPTTAAVRGRERDGEVARGALRHAASARRRAARQARLRRRRAESGQQQVHLGEHRGEAGRLVGRRRAMPRAARASRAARRRTSASSPSRTIESSRASSAGGRRAPSASSSVGASRSTSQVSASQRSPSSARALLTRRRCPGSPRAACRGSARPRPRCGSARRARRCSDSSPSCTPSQSCRPRP